ncbi:hypothetical protein OSTOST_22758, partial [Ostertagia ostertagi]
VACKKCNKEILPGTEFFEVDFAPKCRACCIEDGIRAPLKTLKEPTKCKTCHDEIPAGTPFYQVHLAPKCMGCCIADGTKPSPSSPRSVSQLGISSNHFLQ